MDTVGASRRRKRQPHVVSVEKRNLFLPPIYLVIKCIYLFINLFTCSFHFADMCVD